MMTSLSRKKVRSEVDFGALIETDYSFSKNLFLKYLNKTKKALILHSLNRAC
jgi:hypothetical protein